MIIRPKRIISPEDLFIVSQGLAASMYERERLWNNPPHCGVVIRYRQEYGCYEDSYVAFEFDSAEVEASLREILQESPHLANDEEGALLKWVTTRDVAIKEPTEVPETWSRFKYVADNLVRTGKVARVYCSMCEQEMTVNQLQQDDDHGLPS